MRPKSFSNTNTPIDFFQFLSQAMRDLLGDTLASANQVVSGSNNGHLKMSLQTVGPLIRWRLPNQAYVKLYKSNLFIGIFTIKTNLYVH